MFPIWATDVCSRLNFPTFFCNIVNACDKIELSFTSPTICHLFTRLEYLKHVKGSWVWGEKRIFVSSGTKGYCCSTG